MEVAVSMFTVDAAFQEHTNRNAIPPLDGGGFELVTFPETKLRSPHHVFYAPPGFVQ